jgi:hypothetical protein
MKKSIVLSMGLLVFMSIASVQTNAWETSIRDPETNRVPLKKPEVSKVSEQAKSHFIADFGNVPDVHWKRSHNFDEAVFTRNGKQMTAWYDIDAHLVGTTSTAFFTDLPADGQNAIKNKYKDYTVGDVIFFDDSEVNQTDMILYNQQFDDADNFFVEMSKGKSNIVIMVSTRGEISFFKQI